MKSCFPRLLHLMYLVTLLLAACSSQAQQANITAGRLLTAVAEETPGVAETSAARAVNATPTLSGPTATPEPPLVFARCITRSETQMRLEPNEAALATASLQVSEIITAYGRTPDTKWILSWNKDIAYGWITAGVLGCTAPFEELKPTDANILLITPTPEVTTAQTQTAEPSVVSPVIATVAGPAATETSLPTASDTPLPATEVPPTSPPTVNATTLPATDTPVPVTSLPAASATSTSVPTATTEPSTATAAPTATTQPPTATGAPATATAAPATATAAPTSLPITTALPHVTVIVRVITVTVIVTVTAPPATPLAPAATTAPTPASTPAVEQTESPDPTLTPSPAAVRELACEVTPGTAVNLRRGPSRTAQLLGSLRPGATFVATGRNEDSTWLYGATQQRTFGWLIATSVRCQGELNRLPVVNQ